MTSSETVASRPLPQPDDASRPFFEGATEGRLMIQRCRTCSSALHPGTRICTECLSEEVEWVQSPGRGNIFTYGVMHHVYHPGFSGEIPYVVAVVELKEGIRINTNIVDSGEVEPRVGDPVVVTFRDIGEGVMLPVFRIEG